VIERATRQLESADTTIKDIVLHSFPPLPSFSILSAEPAGIRREVFSMLFPGIGDPSMEHAGSTLSLN